ncbi:MAG: hypothetical protein K2G52_10725 [Muribaculaceae bacterium]|nr:hypothetical protein [Muribaculaceae bacterium]
MSEPSATPAPAAPHNFRKILKAIGWTAACVLALIVIAAVGITLYLTPARLTAIVNREAGNYLKADVKASNVDFSLWSTFPYLHISADSIRIDSRTLNGIPKEIRKSLPHNCDFLVSTGKIGGAVNILKAITGEIILKHVVVSSPTLNLVAYDDKLNNYDIFRKKPDVKKIPHISIDTISIPAPVRLSYFDASARTSARVKVDAMSLANHGTEDTYRLLISGTADGTIKDFHMSEEIPVTADGIIKLKFNPLSATFSKFAVNLAGIKSVTDAEISAGEKTAVNLFSSAIRISDAIATVKSFAGILPWRSVDLKNIKGNIPLDLRIKLSSPYIISSGNGKNTGQPSLPAFYSEMNIPEGWMEWSAAGKKPLELRDLSLSASVNIDPGSDESNMIDIKKCSLTADGAELSAQCKATEILSENPMVSADLKYKADLTKLYAIFFPKNPLRIEGDINGNSEISCRMASGSLTKANDVDIKSVFKSGCISITDRVKKFTASLSGLHVILDAAFPSLSRDSLTDGKISLITSAGKGIFNSMSDSTTVSLENSGIKIVIGAAGSVSKPVAAGKASFNAERMIAVSPGMRSETSDIDVDIDASLRHSPWSYSGRVPSYASDEDSIICRRAKHTPLYLMAEVPSMLQTAMTLSDIKAKVSAKKGSLFSEAFPAENSFSSLSMATDLDTLTLNNIHITTGSSAADISGRVKGLRGFLSSSSPSLLEIDLDAFFSDVNINELAAAYYEGVAATTGQPVKFNGVDSGPYTAGDSLCIAIPRNISADIRLRSLSAEYRGWKFRPLSTEITLRDGIAEIGDLNIGSDFCSASIDWIYSTENLDSIFMSVSVDLNDFDFDNFFTTFPTLPAAHPELGNLSGNLCAKAEGKFLMFPDMFLNTPSLEGEITMAFDSIRYARDSKTARITHLMFLKGDGPLDVKDFKIHGFFHDNLLQVDPFTMKCGGYEVMAAGVNNLQGDMYYHLGLMRSPFHFPFGINIVGDIHHPLIRFGGNGINDGRERQISAELMDSADVNIMRRLREGWLLFIQNAAKYGELDNHGYVSDVP